MTSNKTEQITDVPSFEKGYKQGQQDLIKEVEKVPVKEFGIKGLPLGQWTIFLDGVDGAISFMKKKVKGGKNEWL